MVKFTPTPRLLQAYRLTRYETCGIPFQIGRRTAAVDGLLLARGARTAVFLSAYNPFSRAMPAAWNRRMQQQLRARIRHGNHLCGYGRLRGWSEAHVLVFGDPRPLIKLARLFRQNGIVMLRRGKPPRLVIDF